MKQLVAADKKRDRSTIAAQSKGMTTLAIELQQMVMVDGTEESDLFESEDEHVMVATLENKSSAEKPMRRGGSKKTRARGLYCRIVAPDSPSPSRSKRDRMCHRLGGAPAGARKGLRPTR
jgi:hypothetical protein